MERELGDSVSRRLAARVLGVSHTALDRWIKTGDLPVIYSSQGRVEVPVAALLELHDALQADDAHPPSRYALTSVMHRRRDAARRLRIAHVKGDGEHSGHDRARARGLAYHRAVAQRLSKPMVAEARHVVFRWRDQGRIDERYADQWEQLLDLPARRYP